MSVKVEVNEGNKLIAEFMGGTVREDGTVALYTNMGIPDWAFVKCNFDTMRIGGYEYQTSWDWLIPVVEKIESLGHTVIIEDTSCTIYPVHDGEYGVDTGNKLSSAYECVVDFIQWYNTQNNTQ